MRIIYLLLKPILNYSFRVYFPRMAFNNSPKTFFGRTIFVSNHASSFMDPITIAALNRPIIFFLTRSDVFTKITKPLLWLCHMLPIYRQQDGTDTKDKNEAVFRRCSRILSYGRNLLIFGEGFTDDTFIRRLKPIKKGAVRIGFSTLESINWKKKIHIAAVGINYSDPNKMRSDYLVSYSDKICLNDYREEYERNPNKVIADLTKKIEELMQEQITHVEKKELAPFHENMMIITRKGMNAKSFNRSIPLKKRWKYSQNLAHWLNEQKVTEDSELGKLKTSLEEHMRMLKTKNIESQHVYWKAHSGSLSKEVMALIFLFPFAIIGLVHCFIPYIIAKRFTEKSFKRKVFWGSVKMMLGQLLIAIYNIPVFFLFYYFVYPSWWLAVGYYFSIGLTGLAAYKWFEYLADYKAKKEIAKADITDLINRTEELKRKIEQLVPVA